MFVLRRSAASRPKWSLAMGRARRQLAVKRRGARTPIGPASLPRQWHGVAQFANAAQVFRPMPDGDRKANAALPPEIPMLSARAVTISVMISPGAGAGAQWRRPPHGPAPIAERAETGAFARLSLSASRRRQSARRDRLTAASDERFERRVSDAGDFVGCGQASAQPRHAGCVDERATAAAHQKRPSGPVASMLISGAQRQSAERMDWAHC